MGNKQNNLIIQGKSSRSLDLAIFSLILEYSWSVNFLDFEDEGVLLAIYWSIALPKMKRNKNRNFN